MQEVGNQEAFSSGTLVLPNDERIPLKALGKPDDSVDLDLDMDISDFIDEGDLSAGDATDADPEGSASDEAKESSPK